jgi:predicted phage tail protein
MNMPLGIGRPTNPNAKGRLVRGSKGGGKSGGKKAKAPITAPDTLRSNTIARIFDVYSEGPCGGLVDGLKSVYYRIGTTLTPVMNEDGSLNIEGVSVAEVFGTADQAFVAGTPAVEYEEVVNAQFTTESPAVVEISDETLDAIRVKVLWPRISYVDGKGNVLGASMDIAIDVQSFGGSFVEVVRDQFSGKSETAYEREYPVSLPPGGAPWTVRLRRNEPDSSGLKNYDSFWSSYTGVIWAKQTYPWCAGIHSTVDARQFGEEIAGRAFRVWGIQWQVPTNYDPVTREYATEGPGTTGGIWDGTFKSADPCCGNPAWVFYGLATNKRFGAGDFIEPGMVDKWELYRVAQYCDQMIDDGKGGLIPRFEINTQINSQDAAARMLQVVASAFRGYAYWGAGETPLRVRQDRPRDPSRLFSPANIIGGSVNRETADDLLQHSAAEVSFNDPDDGMRVDIAIYQDVELVQKLGYKPLRIAPFGCDNKARALYFGKWAIEVEKLDETYSFSVGLHDADTEPGEHCLLSDPLRMDVRYGGLVTAATTTSIDLDTAVELLFGEEYVLTVELPDGTLAERVEHRYHHLGRSAGRRTGPRRAVQPLLRRGGPGIDQCAGGRRERAAPVRGDGAAIRSHLSCPGGKRPRFDAALLFAVADRAPRGAPEPRRNGLALAQWPEPHGRCRLQLDAGPGCQGAELRDPDPAAGPSRFQSLGRGRRGFLQPHRHRHGGGHLPRARDRRYRAQIGLGAL